MHQTYGSRSKAPFSLRRRHRAVRGLDQKQQADLATVTIEAEATTNKKRIVMRISDAVSPTTRLLAGSFG